MGHLAWPPVSAVFVQEPAGLQLFACIQANVGGISRSMTPYPQKSSIQLIGLDRPPLHLLPHQGLSGSTPAEVLFAWPPAASDAVAPLLLRRVV